MVIVSAVFPEPLLHVNHRPLRDRLGAGRDGLHGTGGGRVGAGVVLVIGVVVPRLLAYGHFEATGAGRSAAAIELPVAVVMDEVPLTFVCLFLLLLLYFLV